MSRTFKIVREYYDDGRYLYTKKEATLEPGVTVLVGCNGCGKTTFINQIKYQLEDLKIHNCDYNNLVHGGHHSMDKALWHGDLDFVAKMYMSSEGERIRENICNFATNMGRMVTQSRGKECYVLLDAADSGLSIDAVLEYKAMFKVALEHAASINTDLYIIITANEYEMARGEKCYDVARCRYIEFNSYDEYRKFIIESRKKKDKRDHQGHIFNLK